MWSALSGVSVLRDGYGSVSGYLFDPQSLVSHPGVWLARTGLIWMESPPRAFERCSLLRAAGADATSCAVRLARWGRSSWLSPSW